MISDITADNTATSNLVELPGSIGTLGATGYTLAQKNEVSDLMRQGTKQGWYYSLTRFDGYGNVRYTKGIGKSEVIDSFLYTTAYNPDMSYGSTNSCSAKIVGGSERQLYCLPYGICTDPKSKNGTGGFVRAGQGLQELTLGLVVRDCQTNVCSSVPVRWQSVQQIGWTLERIPAKTPILRSTKHRGWA